jgi:hypothetical protein
MDSDGGEIMFKNATLVWDGQPLHMVGDAVIEQPISWTYVRDPNVPPAYSYHKQDGFQIGGGSRVLRAGYQQRVTLNKDQRYLLKAVFTPEVYPGAGQKFEPGSVNAYFKVNGVEGGKSAASPPINLKKQTTLFVIEPTATGEFDISFWLESRWALMEVKMTVHSIELETVSKAYGVPTKVTPVSAPAPAKVGWYDAKISAHPLNVPIYESRFSSNVIATIGTKDMGDDGVPVKVIFSPHTNPRWPIRWGEFEGWFDITLGDVTPDFPPFNINSDRLSKYTVTLPVVGTTVNVQANPGSGDLVGKLATGDEVLHVELGELTDAEKTYVQRLQGDYAYVVLLPSEAKGFVKAKDVQLDPVPTDGETVPKAEHEKVLEQVRLLTRQLESQQTELTHLRQYKAQKEPQILKLKELVDLLD